MKTYLCIRSKAQFGFIRAVKFGDGRIHIFDGIWLLCDVNDAFSKQFEKTTNRGTAFAKNDFVTKIFVKKGQEVYNIIHSA